jgi:hypothetical protein
VKRKVIGKEVHFQETESDAGRRRESSRLIQKNITS